MEIDVGNITREVLYGPLSQGLVRAFLDHVLSHSLAVCGQLGSTKNLPHSRGKKDLIETSELNYYLKHEVMSSCNGLVLETKDNTTIDLYITNPATKQRFALPPFMTNGAPFSYAIAYVAASMEYKVVRTVIPGFDVFKAGEYKRDDCVVVLTVGVDKDWTRRVRIQHLCSKARNLLFRQNPLTTDGFVHWVWDDYSEYVLTLNLETEIITPFLVPTCLPRHEGYTKLMYRYLPMGKYLSLLVDVTRFSWEVWKMKPESGEWTKMFNIDLEPEFASSLYCVLTPLGWLKFGEELIFSVRRVNGKGNKRYNSYCTRICIAYNVRRREYEPFELAPNLDSFLVHRNSLVWLDGC
ncbi:hypothetical protein CASFOL_031173 [Castilleja foliolosa]|uniref:F-box associated beta-propeller type 3 domain-containing protein n=1 Tax=Castilleja foliolosa TaxID=1961234 RepID=A0ABD3C6R0_9LAMI